MEKNWQVRDNNEIDLKVIQKRFAEILHMEKKKESVDRRGFRPLSDPPPIRYSLAGFDWGIGKKFQRFGDYSLSRPGSPKRRAMCPVSVTKYWNNLICETDLRGFPMKTDVMLKGHKHTK